MRSREQELIDLCFSLTFAALDTKYFKLDKLSRDEVGEWIARQLRGCGFDTQPMGMSWGVLKEDKHE